LGDLTGSKERPLLAYFVEKLQIGDDLNLLQCARTNVGPRLTCI
jgi:hypothetical protein